MHWCNDYRILCTLCVYVCTEFCLTIWVSDHKCLTTSWTCRWLNNSWTELVITANVGIVVTVEIETLWSSPSANIAFECMCLYTHIYFWLWVFNHTKEIEQTSIRDSDHTNKTKKSMFNTYHWVVKGARILDKRSTSDATKVPNIVKRWKVGIWIDLVVLSSAHCYINSHCMCICRFECQSCTRWHRCWLSSNPTVSVYWRNLASISQCYLEQSCKKSRSCSMCTQLTWLERGMWV